MDVGGHTREPDWIKLGPSLTIAASLVLAIRTARWTESPCATASSPQWDVEVDRSIRIAQRVLSRLLSQSPQMFPSKDVPWYVPTDEDLPR